MYHNRISAFQYSSSAAGTSVPTVQVGSEVTVSLGDGRMSIGAVVRLISSRDQIEVRFLRWRTRVVHIDDVLLDPSA